MITIKLLIFVQNSHLVIDFMLQLVNIILHAECGIESLFYVWSSLSNLSYLTTLWLCTSDFGPNLYQYFVRVDIPSWKLQVNRCFGVLLRTFQLFVAPKNNTMKCSDANSFFRLFDFQFRRSPKSQLSAEVPAFGLPFLTLKLWLWTWGFANETFCFGLSLLQLKLNGF